MELFVKEGKKGEDNKFELFTSVSLGFKSLMKVPFLGFYASDVCGFT